MLKNPIENFCGVFEKGPSLVKALLEERKKEREREEREFDIEEE